MWEGVYQVEGTVSAKAPQLGGQRGGPGGMDKAREGRKDLVVVG